MDGVQHDDFRCDNDMANDLSVRRRADYGQDAPGVVRGNLGIGLALCILAVGLLSLPPTALAGWGGTAAVILLFAGLSLVLTGLLMIWGSRSGKLRIRDRLLGQVPWRGDERILDAGCGRGLMLNGAARRAPRSRAFGVDIWRSVDQSGNAASQTLSNARAEGVAGRVAIATADMRAMPFPDQCFDVVTTSWAVHNIPERAGRTQAIREILRVLRPGGWLALADIERIDEYIETLELEGVTQIQRSRPYYIFAIPTHTLLVQKP
jgi:SAM-dependent methyltransferase